MLIFLAMEEATTIRRHLTERCATPYPDTGIKRKKMRTWFESKDEARTWQSCDAKIAQTGDRRMRARSLVARWHVATVAILLVLTSTQYGFCQAAAAPLMAQLPDDPRASMQASAVGDSQGPPAAMGSISGIALDVNSGVVPAAQVTLTAEDGRAPMQAIAGSDGSFSFTGLPAGTYRVKIQSPGLQTYLSADIPLRGEETVELSRIDLRMDATSTTMDVVATPEQVAEEQVHEQEKQRVLGVFPNFYTSYIWNAAPMSPKQKFRLAFRAAIDPITFLTVAGVAGGEQLSNTFPGYGSSLEGYGKRYGARYADTFSSRMIGSAILPSLLHQDPRYFYRGSGSITSRALYAMSSAVITRGDNGRL